MTSGFTGGRNVYNQSDHNLERSNSTLKNAHSSSPKHKQSIRKNTLSSKTVPNSELKFRKNKPHPIMLEDVETESITTMKNANPYEQNPAQADLNSTMESKLLNSTMKQPQQAFIDDQLLSFTRLKPLVVSSTPKARYYNSTHCYGTANNKHDDLSIDGFSSIAIDPKEYNSDYPAQNKGAYISEIADYTVESPKKVDTGKRNNLRGSHSKEKDQNQSYCHNRTFEANSGDHQGNGITPRTLDAGDKLLSKYRSPDSNKRKKSMKYIFQKEMDEERQNEALNSTIRSPKNIQLSAKARNERFLYSPSNSMLQRQAADINTTFASGTSQSKRSYTGSIVSRLNQSMRDKKESSHMQTLYASYHVDNTSPQSKDIAGLKDAKYTLLSKNMSPRDERSIDCTSSAKSQTQYCLSARHNSLHSDALQLSEPHSLASLPLSKASDTPHMVTANIASFDSKTDFTKLSQQKPNSSTLTKTSLRNIHLSHATTKRAPKHSPRPQTMNSLKDIDESTMTPKATSLNNIEMEVDKASLLKNTTSKALTRLRSSLSGRNRSPASSRSGSSPHNLLRECTPIGDFSRYSSSTGWKSQANDLSIRNKITEEAEHEHGETNRKGSDQSIRLSDLDQESPHHKLLLENKQKLSRESVSPRPNVENQGVRACQEDVLEEEEETEYMNSKSSKDYTLSSFSSKNRDFQLTELKSGFYQKHNNADIMMHDEKMNDKAPQEAPEDIGSFKVIKSKYDKSKERQGSDTDERVVEEEEFLCSLSTKRNDIVISNNKPSPANSPSKLLNHQRKSSTAEEKQSCKETQEPLTVEEEAFLPRPHAQVGPTESIYDKKRKQQADNTNLKSLINEESGGENLSQDDPISQKNQEHSVSAVAENDQVDIARSLPEAAHSLSTKDHDTENDADKVSEQESGSANTSPIDREELGLSTIKYQPNNGMEQSVPGSLGSLLSLSSPKHLAEHQNKIPFEESKISQISSPSSSKFQSTSKRQIECN